MFTRCLREVCCINGRRERREKKEKREEEREKKTHIPSSQNCLLLFICPSTACYQCYLPMLPIYLCNSPTLFARCSFRFATKIPLSLLSAAAVTPYSHRYWYMCTYTGEKDGGGGEKYGVF